MQKPTTLTLNGHRLSPGNWADESGKISFSTVIRGEHLGTNIVDSVNDKPASLRIDDDLPLEGTARIVEQRLSGSGPTAVMRLRIEFESEHLKSAAELTVEESLAAILSEIRELRREVTLLRGSQSSTASPIPPPRAGTTLIDFAIPVDDNPDTEN